MPATRDLHDLPGGAQGASAQSFARQEGGVGCRQGDLNQALSGPCFGQELASVWVGLGRSWHGLRSAVHLSGAGRALRGST